MKRIAITKSMKMVEKMQRPERKDGQAVLPPDHLCYGCKRYGLGCIHPCYREIKNGGSLEVLLCGS